MGNSSSQESVPRPAVSALLPPKFGLRRALSTPTPMAHSSSKESSGSAVSTLRSPKLGLRRAASSVGKNIRFLGRGGGISHGAAAREGNETNESFNQGNQESPRPRLTPDQKKNLSILKIRKQGSFHEALVRERDKLHDFDDIYEVLNEIGNGGLCKIFRVRKYDDRIGGSSRSEGVRKKNHGLSLRSLQVRRRCGPNNAMLSSLSPQTLSRRRTLVGPPLPPPPPLSCPPPSELENPEFSSSSSAVDRLGRIGLLNLRRRAVSVERYLGRRPAALTQGDRVQSASSSPPMFFALKVINLGLVKEDNIDQLKNEVEILKSLDHKNIIKAYETFQMKRYKKLMIVMELCTGGDMYARMPYTELQVAGAMRQILSAIAYMHSIHIIHRDIKMENIMWESEHPLAAVKVIDFGLSKRYSPHNDIFTERIGTLYSMSPETMKGIYTAQADAWSLGVITYIMLSREKPFDGDTPKQLVANVLKCNYDFKTTTPPVVGNVWDNISEQAKSFIRNLLVCEPAQRMTADQAKTHEWFDICMQQLKPKQYTNGHNTTTSYRKSPDVLTGKKPDNALENWEEVSSLEDENDFCIPTCTSAEFKNRVRENIIKYAEMGEFRRLALNVIAKKSTSEEIFELRRVFDEFDTLNTGTITWEEFKAALAQFNYDEEEILHIFRSVDVNRNNVINYTEFLAAALETQGSIEEYRIAEAFDLLDSDDSGYISRDNLRQLLGDRGKDEAYIDRLIAEVDPSKNGCISYEEFLQVFSRQQRNDTVAHLYLEHSNSFAARVEQENEAEKVLTEHGIEPLQLPFMPPTSANNSGHPTDLMMKMSFGEDDDDDDEFQDAQESHDENTPQHVPAFSNQCAPKPESSHTLMEWNLFNPLKL